MSSSKFNTIFPVDGTHGNVSYPFEVVDNPVMVQMKGLERCDYVFVEFWFGDECEGTWEPFALCNTPCCGCPGLYEVMYPVNTFFLNIPNKYRLVVSSTDEERANDPTSFSDVEIIVKKLSKSVDISHYL